MDKIQKSGAYLTTQQYAGDSARVSLSCWTQYDPTTSCIS